MSAGGSRLAAMAVGLALLCAPESRASAAGPTQNAVAKVKVVKPLVLTWAQDFDLGTVLLGPGTFANATVRLSRTGAFSCAAPLACSGAVQVAQYRVAGTNNQMVTITAPPVILVNQADPTKQLTLTVDSPGTITLNNSGPQGMLFSLGGSMQFSSTTADGTYAGTFNVTVDY